MHEPSINTIQKDPVDDLTRVFNTALVAPRAGATRDFAAEIAALIATPAFLAILGSVRELARSESISENAAAEEIIRTFRGMDRLWSDYLFREGLDRMKN